MPEDRCGDGPVEVDVEAAGQVVEFAVDGLAAEPAEEVDELPAGHVLVEAQLAGQVGDVAAGGDAVVPAVVAGDRGAGRAVGRRKPSSRRRAVDLAGAVGAEQAEHLARRDVQVEVVEGAEAAVVLGQVLGAQQHAGPCRAGRTRSPRGSSR